jgi:hypothetical protein
MVVKAVSEEGVRLNIQKATLREWRACCRHGRTSFEDGGRWATSS